MRSNVDKLPFFVAKMNRLFFPRGGKKDKYVFLNDKAYRISTFNRGPEMAYLELVAISSALESIPESILEVMTLFYNFYLGTISSETLKKRLEEDINCSLEEYQAAVTWGAFLFWKNYKKETKKKGGAYAYKEKHNERHT